MSDMRDVIMNQSEQISRSLEVNKNVKVSGKFDSIILAGMGGSGHPGDLLNALSLPTVPLYVHRNYDLPLAYLTQLGLTRPLVIASSYSGNTEEALSAYQATQQKNLPLVVSASGGTLQEWATRDSVPFCHIDFPDMQPRHTLLAAFTGLYAALKNSGLVRDITSDLERVAQALHDVTPSLEAPGEQLAKKITGKIPVYLAGENLAFAAKNFKIQTNENAKYPAFWNTFPELNHNELLGFSKLKESHNPNHFIAVVLRDDTGHPRNQTRMDVTAELYQQWGVTVEQFTAPGESLLEKILTSVTFGLWTTYYLAKLNNIDPIPVEGVESFKKKLEEVAGKIA